MIALFAIAVGGFVALVSIVCGLIAFMVWKLN